MYPEILWKDPGEKLFMSGSDKVISSESFLI